jgi:hypothetical protein
MEGPLYRLLISSRSVIKHGCHRQFLFLIGRFLKISVTEKKIFLEINQSYKVVVYKVYLM